tara:strand:- start:66 stop:401 length:336 start_codon:yes stop_codon:yes gene_type:complete
MAFADSSTCFNTGDGSIIGGFTEKEHGKFFEFSSAKDEDYAFGIVPSDFTHRVWVTSPWKMDRGYRMAKVLKTVAYVLVDEDEMTGEAVIEKWYTKGYSEYSRSNGIGFYR